MKTYGPIFVLTLALAIANAIQAQAQVATAESSSGPNITRPQVLPRWLLVPFHIRVR